jgi:hypothetical protein
MMEQIFHQLPVQDSLPTHFPHLDHLNGTLIKQPPQALRRKKRQPRIVMHDFRIQGNIRLAGAKVDG